MLLLGRSQVPRLGAILVGCIPAGDRAVIRRAVVLFCKMAIKIVDELPVFQELSFGNPVDIEGNSDALLQEYTLHMFEVISILVFIFRVEHYFLRGRA